MVTVNVHEGKVDPEVVADYNVVVVTDNYNLRSLK